MAAIILMGKSYPFLSEKMPEQSVVIKDNYLECEDVGQVDTLISDNAGISMIFSSNVTIENNFFAGFSIGVDAGDHFRGKYYHVNNIKLHNNTFDRIKNTAVNVDCEPQLMEIVNNEIHSTLLKNESVDFNSAFIKGNVYGNIIIKNNKAF